MYRIEPTSLIIYEEYIIIEGHTNILVHLTMLWPKRVNRWEGGTLRLSRMVGSCPCLLAVGVRIQNPERPMQEGKPETSIIDKKKRREFAFVEEE